MKEIFRTLKKKQIYEAIPLLIKISGEKAETSEENLGVVHSHFSSLFAPPDPPSGKKKEALREIERCRKKVVSPYLASCLEAKLDAKEIEEAISQA